MDMEVADEAARLAARAGVPSEEIRAMRARLIRGDRPDCETYRRKVRRTDSDLALNLIGRRGEISPRDVITFTHRSHESADLGEFLNRECYGLTTAGRIILDNGVLVVWDLRPRLAEEGIPAAAP